MLDKFNDNELEIASKLVFDGHGKEVYGAYFAKSHPHGKDRL